MVGGGDSMNGDKKFEYVFKKGRAPSEGYYPGLNPRVVVDDELGIICEYDVAVPLRDGTKIYVNVFRPKKEGRYPVIVCWTAYGKHNPPMVRYSSFPGCGVSDADLSKYAIFEGADPAYWCKYGYVVIHADPRGLWGSEGDYTHMSEQEAQDCYDLIEWAAVQPWSNGNVGMTGVSYLAAIQWKVAALNPPHLKAINPWEGLTDFYREFAYHGGIPCDFPLKVAQLLCFSNSRVEDIEEMMFKRHRFFDDYWKSLNPDLKKIKVPAFVVASWSDHGLHTRGTLEGFKQISSEEKWLRVHGGKKWQDYHQNVELQRMFFDRYLKNIDNDWKYWPRVMLEVRDRGFLGYWRAENEWPIARTEYVKLYLNAQNGTMGKCPFPEENFVRYDARTGRALFEYIFDERTELTGHMMLKLWVESIDNDDMDLFVIVEKLDRSGHRVPFPIQTIINDGPAALGWLRVSHRELDEEKSTFHQPVLKHERELKLKPGEIVPVYIEIWPTSILFHRGEKLQLIIQGHDYELLKGSMHLHSQTVNKGEHVIYTGGKYDSYLLIPIIPPRELTE